MSANLSPPVETPAFALRCYYRPGGAEDRLAIRIPHLEYMIAALPIKLFGGAILADDGSAIGMEVILRVPDRAAAERFLAAEPYARAGLFERVEITPVRPMVPPGDGTRLHAELARERARRAPGR